MRSRHLYEVFTQVNKIVRKKEKRKRKLIKEARRLQREADAQVNILKEIQKIEHEYELKIRSKVMELEAQLQRETP